jgi:hypothetical protein
MGYTHYWKIPKTVPNGDWHDIVRDVAKIIEATNIPLALEYDEPEKKPEISPWCIQFNGVGDDGHETFLIKPDLEEFSFCKTARKPYDTVVVAVLAYLGSVWPQYFDISSDGDPADWEDGIALARRALPDRGSIRAPYAVTSA